MVHNFNQSFSLQLKDEKLAEFYGILRSYWAEAENQGVPSGLTDDGYGNPGDDQDDQDGDASDAPTTDVDTPESGAFEATLDPVPSTGASSETHGVVEVDSQDSEPMFTESQLWTDAQPRSPFTPFSPESPKVDTEIMGGNVGDVAGPNQKEKESMPPPPIPGPRLTLGGVTFRLPAVPPPGMEPQYVRLVQARVEQLKKLSIVVLMFCVVFSTTNFREMT